MKTFFCLSTYGQNLKITNFYINQLRNWCNFLNVVGAKCWGTDLWGYLAQCDRFIYWVFIPICRSFSESRTTTSSMLIVYKCQRTKRPIERCFALPFPCSHFRCISLTTEHCSRPTWKLQRVTFIRDNKFRRPSYGWLKESDQHPINVYGHASVMIICRINVGIGFGHKMCWSS